MAGLELDTQNSHIVVFSNTQQSMTVHAWPTWNSVLYGKVFSLSL
jgi:hypothetical protein